MKVIYVLLVCLLAFTSCAETEYTEKGVGEKDITGYGKAGFYSLDGVSSFTLDNETQIALNAKRLTYRLQNTDQSKYIHVQFAEKPAVVGQKVKISFTCQGLSFLKKEAEMEVVRIDEGMMWLTGEDAGIVMPVFNH